MDEKTSTNLEKKKIKFSRVLKFKCLDDNFFFLNVLLVIIKLCELVHMVLI